LTWEISRSEGVGGVNLMSQRFAPASTVRHVEVDGLRVILDLRLGSYRILDQSASSLWPILTGEGDASVLMQNLTDRYAVGQGALQRELQAFADRCVAEGLLVPVASDEMTPPDCMPHRLLRKAVPRRPSRRSMFAALYCLIATQLLLARKGFVATYNRYMLLSAGSDSISLATVLPAFARAENFFLARRAPEDCLVRSLALFRFLRSANVAAEHVIGVRRLPFTAHAWVEFGGSPLLEDGVYGFTPLARIGTPRRQCATPQ
jgi:hypothetical protein